MEYMKLSISEGSPLKRIPDTIVPHQRLIFDGIRYAISMILHSYSDIFNSLNYITIHNPNLKEKDYFTPLFLNAWNIIDTSHRLKLLIKRFSDFEKIYVFTDFINSIEDISELRNRMQHLHSRLEFLKSKKVSVWGCIHWISISDRERLEGKQHVLIAGPISNNVVKIKPCDIRNLKREIGFIKLIAHDKIISFDDVILKVGNILKYLEEILKKQFENLPFSGSDYYIVFDFKLNKKETIK